MVFLPLPTHILTDILRIEWGYNIMGQTIQGQQTACVQLSKCVS
jgi:hypothetical protein